MRLCVSDAVARQSGQTGSVATGRDRGLLFLDVDGTVLPHDAADPVAGERDWAAWQQPTNPALSRISRAVGTRLLALGCELARASGWAEDANLVIAPILGLPPLPVVSLPEYPEGDYYHDGLHWKTRALVSAPLVVHPSGSMTRSGITTGSGFAATIPAGPCCIGSMVCPGCWIPILPPSANGWTHRDAGDYDRICSDVVRGWE